MTRQGGDETTRSFPLTRGRELAQGQVQAARLYVASRARDVDELRELLDMLGLNGRPIRVRHGKGGGRTP